MIRQSETEPNLEIKKLKGFTKCPNCEKVGLTIPLTEIDGNLVCGFCDLNFKIDN